MSDRKLQPHSPDRFSDALTDVTGSVSAKKAILVIYDIFGFFPQTIQGADILAASEEYQVFMPDFFEGQPADIAWYLCRLRYGT
jgi:dienelactone hydrolase